MHIDNSFSPDSKVWIYQSSRPFTQDEINILQEQLESFTKQWTAHNAQLKAHGDIIEDRIIYLIVDETHTSASGCSIDTSVHFIKSLENKFNIGLFDRTLFNYLKEGVISTAHLNELPELFSTQVINMETIVFDPLVNSKSAFDAHFKTTLGKSWLKNFAQ